jgi:hypothetical protein
MKNMRRLYRNVIEEIKSASKEADLRGYKLTVSTRLKFEEADQKW